MRVSREKAAQNRARIVEAASRLFRERGLSGVGVDALTEAAGLTHGSLYSQFGSKERLAVEAMGHALASSSARMKDARTLQEYALRYLSPDHRDQCGEGCVVAALGGDMPRQGAAVRARFTDAVRGATERIARLSPNPATAHAEDEALADFATMVGALILARGVDDTDLSDRTLAAARHRLSARASQPAAAQEP